MPPLDPVAAYDRLAAEYARISEARQRYLSAVAAVIVAEARGRAQTMLDVGSGDGRRATHIARELGIPQLTLLEPSAAMRARWPCEVETWPIRAEELSSKTGIFDLITSLWNVLGHVFPAQARGEVLRQMARLLAPGGAIFVDISHRYNMRHYGVVRTLGRMLRDAVKRDVSNGDVVAHWSLEGHEIATRGHVFNSSEFERMLPAAGLRVERRLAIDYASGRVCRSKYCGHLLYLLRISSSRSGTDAST